MRASNSFLVAYACVPTCQHCTVLVQCKEQQTLCFAVGVMHFGPQPAQWQLAKLLELNGSGMYSLACLAVLSMDVTSITIYQHQPFVGWVASCG